MRMLQSVLFATDFSTASRNAIPVVARLAKGFGALIKVLHVVEPYSKRTVAYYFVRKFGNGWLKTIAQEFARHKVDVAESSLVAGPTADSIVRYAAEMDADLIVLGAGTMKADQTFKFGSVAQSVIEHAIQPVLVIHPGASETKILRTILCPVDHSSVSRRGLRNAIHLAKVFRSRLVVLSVVPEVSWLEAVAETGEWKDVKAEYAMQWCDEMESFLANISFEGVSHTKELQHGVPHEQIVAVAKEQEADLIVMGATGHTGLVRVLLGSTTRRVLRDLPCSLLTVKQEDVIEELLEDDLRNIELHMAEGRALRDAGSHDLAATRFRRVLARNPFHVDAVECLAEAHEKLGNQAEAKSFTHRAKRLRNQEIFQLLSSVIKGKSDSMNHTNDDTDEEESA